MEQTENAGWREREYSFNECYKMNQVLLLVQCQDFY